MLEQYFIKPQTLDRIRHSWLRIQLPRMALRCTGLCLRSRAYTA